MNTELKTKGLLRFSQVGKFHIPSPERLGLTFKEAYSILFPDEATPELAEKWKCTENNVLNLRRKGWAKINAYTDDKDLISELAPSSYWHVF